MRRFPSFWNCWDTKIITLSFWEELSDRQIAEIMEVTPRTSITWSAGLLAAYASSMKSEDEIHKLSYMLITQAVAGDENALSEILNIYESYHNALVT